MLLQGYPVESFKTHTHARACAEREREIDLQGFFMSALRHATQQREKEAGGIIMEKKCENMRRERQPLLPARSMSWLSL